MGKFSKMLYMLDLLNTGNKYSVTTLAKKLGVSERMIRYYKDELLFNGIVIESFKGPNGGYFLFDKQKNYLYLNKYDIKLLENIYIFLQDNNFNLLPKYEELLEKIKNISDITEEKNSFIYEDNPDFNNNVINILQTSIKTENSVNISYLDLNGKTYKREIYPLYFFKFKNNNYITAYCKLRNDIRHFEIARIKEIK